MPYRNKAMKNNVYTKMQFTVAEVKLGERARKYGKPTTHTC